MHSTDIQVRFGDTDAKGHLNNAVFAAYTEVARLAFLDSVGIPANSLILAHLSIDYLRQVRYGNRVRVESYIEIVGRSSMTIRQHVMADDVLAADVKAVAVYFNFDAQRSEVIPDAMRSALSASMNATSDAQNSVKAGAR